MRALEVTDTLHGDPHIALLPGLDGTGELFSPIVPFLEKHFEIHVVRYTDEFTFSDYVESAAAQLPKNGSISLVAESFSGPIAISLLASKNPIFQASVLSATFCKSPLPFLTQISKHLPEKLFSSNPVSKAFLDLLITGGDANSDVRKKARELLGKVNPKQFQSRINIINEINVSQELKDIEVPLLYIQATKDRIVLADSGSEIMKHAKNLKIERVAGSHLILQTQPEKCAELIINHVTSNKRTQSDMAEPRR
jgi:pimeloyl-[acyl-carrier protein] methyl ester esterase